MNYKKSILFTAFLSLALNVPFMAKADLNPSYDPSLPCDLGSSDVDASRFTWPNWFHIDTQKADFAQMRDTAAMYLGYITAVIIAEQLHETCVHYYNKSYADHAKKFKDEINNTGLAKPGTQLSCLDENKLKMLAWEFRNPLYRYTLGWFVKNRLEQWLQQQIERKANDKNYVIGTNDLNNHLILGTY